MKQLFATVLLVSALTGPAFGQGDARSRGTGSDQPAPAQTRRVTGRVVDAAGAPIVGATVAVVERSSGKQIGGTYSDANGNFAVDVDPSRASSIRITYIGFASQVYPVTETTTTLNAVLQEGETTLATQVIETGIGTIDVGSKTGSIYSIKGEDFLDMPTTSFARAIQGRIPGVNVVTQNGVPGSLPSIRIRGIGSIGSGTEPLYIIDGMRMNVGPNQGTGGADRGRLGITGSILNSINPNDIETFTVLVEASQTAPYGAEGANGVVIINTKKGKAGKTAVTLDYQRGVTELIRKADIMNATEWQQYQTEAILNTGGTLTTFNNSYGAFIAAGNNINHMDQLYRTGTTENFDVSVSGGTDRTTFALSAGYNFSDAQSRGVKYERGVLRLNIGHRLDDIWKIEFSNNVSVQELNASTTTQGGNFVNNLQRSALLLPPVTPMFLNGDYNLTNGTTGLFNYESELRNQRVSITNGLLSNLRLIATIKPWLTNTTSAGLDWSEIEERVVNNPFTQTGSGTNGSVTNGSARDINYQLETRFNLQHTFASVHNLSGVVGVNFRKETRRFMSAQGTSLAFPNLDQLGNTATPAGVAGNFVQSAKINFFNQVSYNYKERYYFTGAFGISSSSRFGPNVRYGYFPSVSGKVRLTKEPWFPKPSWLSELGIRASWGETGNDAIPQNEFLASIGTGGAYNSLPGLSVTSLPNPNLGWETNRISDIGLDASFFDDRITTTLSFYSRQTVDALFNRQVSALGAFPSDNTVRTNIAKLENLGWEFELTTKNFIGEFKWETTVNLTYLENKIVSLPNGDEPANGLWQNRAYGAIQVARYAGVNPADGRPFYYDANQNITYFPTVADNQFIRGNQLQPTFYGGLENQFSWKGITVTALFNFETGRQGFVQDRFFSAYARTERNQTRDMLNRWTTPGQVTGVPIAWAGSSGPGFSSASTGGSGNASSALWSDASFLRLRQVTINYKLPSKITSKLGLSEVSIYGQGVNLWTYTRYIGIDPELVGAEASVIPQARQFSAGVRVTL